jgi:IS30 family transposase
MSRLSERDVETIVAMRERGASYRAIGHAIGKSKGVVSWHCLRLAVDPPQPAPLRPDYHLLVPVVRRGNHQVRAFTPAEDARLLELEAQGLGYAAIGRALGRRPNSIKGRLMTLARREERAAS